MKEFEHRFKIESRNKIESKISEIGFKKQVTKKQLDLIFEKEELSNFDAFPPGYWIIRLRIEDDRKSKLEMKERIDDNTWEEHPFEISNPENAIYVLSKMLNASRIISKERQVWKSDKSNVEIAVDDVDKLGSFIEFEGPENEVLELIEILGFNLKESQPPYGTLIYRMQKQNKLSFNLNDFYNALKNAS